MKSLVFVLAIMCATVYAHAQSKLEPAGKFFWAITVPDAMATSAWYEEKFQMKLFKEIKGKENGLVLRIITNDAMTIEILSSSETKPLSVCSITQEDVHNLRGIFKTGFYVKDIDKAAQYLKDKGIKIKYGIFEDEATRSRSLIFTDINGYMVQLMQDK